MSATTRPRSIECHCTFRLMNGISATGGAGWAFWVIVMRKTSREKFQGLKSMAPMRAV
jgi:hypothetical protein